jgi:hypothetical protein
MFLLTADGSSDEAIPAAWGASRSSRWRCRGGPGPELDLLPAVTLLSVT